MLDKLGGRKVIITIVALAVAVSIVLIKGDLPEPLNNLIQFLVGALIAGNAVEHIRDAVVEKAQIQADSAPDTLGPEDAKDIKQGLELLTNGMAQMANNMAAMQALNQELLTTSQINQQGLSLLVERLVPKPKAPVSEG